IGRVNTVGCGQTGEDAPELIVGGAWVEVVQQHEGQRGGGSGDVIVDLTFTETISLPFTGERALQRLWCHQQVANGHHRCAADHAEGSPRESTREPADRMHREVLQIITRPTW